MRGLGFSLCLFAFWLGCVVQRGETKYTSPPPAPQQDLSPTPATPLPPAPAPAPAPPPPSTDAPPPPPPPGGAPVTSKTPLVPPPLPRVLVYFQGDQADFFNSYVEEHFVNAGFKLIDRNQLQVIKAVDAALSSGDPQKFKALRYRFGVEVLVSGKIRREFKDSRKVYGRVMNFYSYRVAMKAIEADTAQIIYSKSAYTFEAASDRHIIQRIKDLAALFAEKLRQFWAKERYGKQSFEIVVSRINHKRLARFENYLKGLPNVSSFARRSFYRSTAFLEIDFQGNMTTLENLILKCPFYAFRVVRTTSSRLEIEFVGERAQSGPKVGWEVWIDGKVDKPGSRVWVNGKEVPVKNGKWRIKIDISKVKRLEIIAIDPYGNKTREVRVLGGN